MYQLTLIPRACPICSTRDESRLFAEANFRLDALDKFAFASRKLPEYMHWRLSECQSCDLLCNAGPAPSLEVLLATLYRGRRTSIVVRKHGMPAIPMVASWPASFPNYPDKNGAVDIGTGRLAPFCGIARGRLRKLCRRRALPLADRGGARPSVRPLIRQDTFQGDSFARIPEPHHLLPDHRALGRAAHFLSRCHGGRSNRVASCS